MLQVKQLRNLELALQDTTRDMLVYYALNMKSVKTSSPMFTSNSFTGFKAVASSTLESVSERFKPLLQFQLKKRNCLIAGTEVLFFNFNVIIFSCIRRLNTRMHVQ